MTTDNHIHYKIKVKSQLDVQWQEWFDDLSVTPTEDGNTTLSGVVVDEAALYGLLRKVRDLGVPLLSIVCVQSGQTEVSDVKL